MKELENHISQLKEQTWELARQSLDAGNTLAFRTLTDIVEKLTNLIVSTKKTNIEIKNEDHLIPIFSYYGGKRHLAKIDGSKIFGDIGQCVLMDGKWWSVSSAAIEIVKNSINPPVNPNRNGWKFWNYVDASGKQQSIDKLRNK